MTTSGQRTRQSGLSGLSAPDSLLDCNVYAYSETVQKVSRIARKQTYIARALILFNLYGVPLSYGPYLEYYYNTTTYGNTSLLYISAPQAAQLLCMYAIPLPIAWLYQKEYWRGSVYWSSTSICICQIMPVFCRSWLHLLVVRGIVQGIALGTLGTVSTLCMASHYRNNIPLASMVGSAFGFLGALIYTTTAYVFLPNSRHSSACYANLTISAATLGLAVYLTKKDAHFITLNSDAGLFFLGFGFLSSGIYVYPTFIVLLLASAPGLVLPGTATLHLMIMFAIAAPFAAFASSAWLRTRLGAVSAFVCASLVAGVCYVLPAWMPYAHVSLVSTPIYGACLGTAVALYVRVMYTVSTFKGDGSFAAPHAQMGLVLAGSGLFAAVVILAVALAVDYGEQGFQWAFTGIAAVAFAGGCLMGSGRMLGMGWRCFLIV